MIRTDYDDLVEAIDAYREVQANRERDLSAPGHYDPCDTQKAHYEMDLRDAERRLDAVFGKLVRKHQHGCGCPGQAIL